MNLFQEEIVPNLEEGREGRATADDGPEVLEALAQSPQNVKDEDPVLNRGAQIDQGIGHALHLAAVLRDVEVALDKSTKGSINMKSASLAITEKLVLEGEQKWRAVLPRSRQIS